MRATIILVSVAAFVGLGGCRSHQPSDLKQTSRDAEAAERTKEIRLDEKQAAQLASRLANQKCQECFERRPFSPADYSAAVKQNRWTWGVLDPAGINGYSARVAFDLDGGNPEVEVFLSTDQNRWHDIRRFAPWPRGSVLTDHGEGR